MAGAQVQMIEGKCPTCHEVIFYSEQRRDPRFVCPHCSDELALSFGKIVADGVTSRDKISDSSEKKLLHSVSTQTHENPPSPNQSQPQNSMLSIERHVSEVFTWPTLVTFLLAVFVCASVAAWLSNSTNNEITTSSQVILDPIERESSKSDEPKRVTEKDKRKEDFLLQQIMNSRAVFPSAARAEIITSVNHVAPAVVTIVATGSSDNGLGSGFVVNRKDWIVTSLRVITGFNACQALARSPDGTVIETRTITGFVGCDENADVVVLTLDKQWPADPLPLERSGLIGLIGSQVFGVAALDGSTNYVINGCFLGSGTTESFQFEGVKQSVNTLQTDIPFTAGLRGGPLCSTKGKVLGLMVPGATVKELDSSENPNQWLHAIAAQELSSILGRCVRKPKPLSKLPRYR